MSDPLSRGTPGGRGFTARIVAVFLTSRLSLLFLLASFLAGALALAVTPREEEPQIVVPVADVIVEFPGASVEETEKLVSTPLEEKLWEIDGVEYVYSVSRPGMAVVTVRFYVGEDREDSLVKTWNKVMSNQDVIPPGVASWIVKPVEIDDVPIVLLTLWSRSGRLGGDALRRIGDEILDKLVGVRNAGRSAVFGGERRRVLVYLDPARLAARNLAPADVPAALGLANVNVRAGRFQREGREVILEAGPSFSSAAEIAGTVVGLWEGRPIHLRDVARILDGTEEPESYARIGAGPAGARMRRIGGGPLRLPPDERPAVTVAVAKRKGTNSVQVAEEVLRAVEEMKGTVIPDDVEITVTRDYGETADHKVNELVKHLLLAVATIIVLLAFALGPREAFVVAIAVPMTLAITLLLDFLFGYTINRVTLFALILSLGLLVDDPIVDVENIYRHFRLRREPPLDATLTAVDEVRPPTILATFTVIVSFLPMFFITGMMGPYMAPMAFNVPVAMLLSLIVAFTVTPWAAYHLLRGHVGQGEEAPYDLRASRTYRLYRRVIVPLLEPRRARRFLLGVAGAFILSALLPVIGAVPLKMLPFDNKNELQILIDMPRGTALEETDAVARDLGRFLNRVPEVTDYETYTGIASPVDFNGLVRGYYLRRGGNLGDIRVNLLPQAERRQQSHEIALRIRLEIERIGRAHRANLKIVEVPPGPPVLSTLVAEVRGATGAPYGTLIEAARRVRRAFEGTKGVVDVDDSVEEDQEKIHVLVDREKAALAGVAPRDVSDTLALALGGGRAGTVHVEGERLPLEIAVRLPRAARSSVADLLDLRVKGREGNLVPLREIATADREGEEQAIYHKNLRPVVWVTGEMAGRSPVDAVFDLLERFRRHPPEPPGTLVDLAGEGEWKITLDVFRDLGLAFAAALVMIYVLLVAQTGSLRMPLVMMVAIPLTVIGIMPGFFLLNLFFAHRVGPYPNPIFFTATGMIGMIALAGIVVRNSIILIDFIEHIRARGDGSRIEEAVIEAGATRLRPILLTAGAAMSGSFVITLDPIFSGLAWSFIFGIFASTAFSLLVVPVIWFLIHRAEPGPARPVPDETHG